MGARGKDEVLLQPDGSILTGGTVDSDKTLCLIRTECVEVHEEVWDFDQLC